MFLESRSFSDIFLFRTMFNSRKFSHPICLLLGIPSMLAIHLLQRQKNFCFSPFDLHFDRLTHRSTNSSCFLWRSTQKVPFSCRRSRTFYCNYSWLLESLLRFSAFWNCFRYSICYCLKSLYIYFNFSFERNYFFPSAFGLVKLSRKIKQAHFISNKKLHSVLDRYCCLTNLYPMI